MSWRDLMNPENKTYTQNPQNPQKVDQDKAFDTIGDIGDKTEKVKSRNDDLFNADVDRVKNELKEVWKDAGIEMDDIPLERRRYALELDKKMTDSANAGDYANARDALEKWRDCWMPVEDVAEAEWRIAERAAIMEFDGGLPREEAEALARDYFQRKGE